MVLFMRIIDFEKKGNVVGFYLGSSGDYYGDDWEDKPYEHNAGRVYERFIEGYKDVAFGFDYTVLEPADNTDNSDVCKDDMKNASIPCLIVIKCRPGDVVKSFDYYDNRIADPRVVKIYFDDSIDKVLKLKCCEVL